MGIISGLRSRHRPRDRAARRRDTARAELGFLLVAGVVGFFVAAHFEIFEAFVAWAREFDALQFDDLIMVLVLETFGLGIYAYRRYREAQADLRRLAETEHDLAATSERYRSLFEYHTHPVFSIDRDGRYDEVNAAAAHLGGRSAEEMRGMGFDELVAPEDLERTSKAFDKVLDREPQELEIGVIHKAGHRIDLCVTALPIVVSDRVVGVFVLAEDVTERNRLRRELDGALEVAEKASEAKSLFLANMSHEIRTPLTSVLGTTELLMDTALDERQARFMQVINQRGHELRRLVDDILDFSRIEAGATVVEAVPFDLRAAVEHVVHDPRANAERKGLEFGATVDPRLPATVVGDAGRLGQVLGNLLGNAVKFTESGWIRLSVDCCSQDADTVEVLFSVMDSGIGVDPAKQGLLFESFAQADPSITRRYGGTGLGLAICQELVELMGGTIELESSPGAGSTFSVRLPLGRLADRGAAEHRAD